VLGFRLKFISFGIPLFMPYLTSQDSQLATLTAIAAVLGFPLSNMSTACTPIPPNVLRSQSNGNGNSGRHLSEGASNNRSAHISGRGLQQEAFQDPACDPTATYQVSAAHHVIFLRA
jgi:hypothetical protein